MNLLACSASCLDLCIASSFALLNLIYRHLKYCSRVRELQKMPNKCVEKLRIGDDVGLGILTFEIQ